MRWAIAFLCGALVVALPAQGASRSEPRSMTIRLVSITTQSRVVKDTSPKNELNKGDVLRGRSTLRNAVVQFGRRKGAIVGSDVSTLTIVSARANKSDVTVTANLPGGTLRAAGRIDGSDPLHRIPVRGGTGVFAGARGVLETSPRQPPGSPPARTVYRLQIP